MRHIVFGEERCPGIATEGVVVLHGLKQIVQRRRCQNFLRKQRMPYELTQHASAYEEAVDHGFLWGRVGESYLAFAEISEGCATFVGECCRIPEAARFHIAGRIEIADEKDPA